MVQRIRYFLSSFACILLYPSVCYCESNRDIHHHRLQNMLLRLFKILDTALQYRTSLVSTTDINVLKS